MASAGVGDEVQISWRGGGWGGRSAPPSSTLACLLASVFGFFSAKQTYGKAKAKRERRTAAKEKERKTERKTDRKKDRWIDG